MNQEERPRSGRESESILVEASRRELRLFWDEADAQLIEGQPLHLLGHPAGQIVVPPPLTLPPASAVVREHLRGNTAFLLLTVLQQGSDIAGHPVHWRGFDFDHIHPESLGGKLVFGNTQLLHRCMNSKKHATPQPEFLAELHAEGYIDAERRAELERQHERRLADPNGFLTWQLRQAQKAYESAQAENSDA